MNEGCCNTRRSCLGFSFMGLCMAGCLVSPGRSWVCVWHGALFPRVVHGSVYGMVPSIPGSFMGLCMARCLVSPGRPWVCLWDGALFTWSSMGLCMARCLVHLVVHGSVYGTVPCSPGRPWVCVWHDALFPRQTHPVVHGVRHDMPCSHYRVLAWSFMVCGTTSWAASQPLVV